MELTKKEINLILDLIDKEKHEMNVFDWLVAKSIKEKIGGIKKWN